MFYFNANDQDYTYYNLEDAKKEAANFTEVRKIRHTNGTEYFL